MTTRLDELREMLARAKEAHDDANRHQIDAYAAWDKAAKARGLPGVFDDDARARIRMAAADDRLWALLSRWNAAAEAREQAHRRVELLGKLIRNEEASS